MKLSIRRNILIERNGKQTYELHIFADASERAHGVVAYLRAINGSSVSSAFLCGKARVNPLKVLSIPRLELVAAVLAGRLRVKIESILDFQLERTIMWTDSMTVLRYLRNKVDRFNIFVANRITLIRERSKNAEWRYVDTKSNPADEATRAVQTSRWIDGPNFLLRTESEWPREPMMDTIPLPEVRKVLCASVKSNPSAELINRYSSWRRLRRAVAYWLKFFKWIGSKKTEKVSSMVTAIDIVKAENQIVKFTQSLFFGEELVQLRRGEPIKKSSSLRKLDAQLDGDLIRVGGRLNRAKLGFREMHPVVLPGKCQLTDIVIQDCHERMGHLGCATVLGTLRERYWILRGNSAVKRILSRGVTCRKVQGSRMQQKMADLPPERVQAGGKPFLNTGLDCFGPFIVKKGRRHEKRYGVIFTCMAVRAIHLEIVYDLTTDSMLNAIRRFLARRGRVEKFISDNGTNFTGSRKEIFMALHDKSVRRGGTEWGIDWHLNPPTASNYGGAWERLIRTVRRVLESTMGKQILTDDTLATLLCEAEMAVNSRPLSIITSDPGDWKILTPNKLLTLHEGPGTWTETSNVGSNSKRRWRQVQCIADQFWRRWVIEYRSSLQERRKWCEAKRNVCPGDIVLVVDENEVRCHWSMGVVAEVYHGSDGLVRTVTVRAGKKIYKRPVSKLVLLLENEDLL